MQRLLESIPRQAPRLEAAVLVVGSGVAGLSAALAAARRADVLLVTKSWLSDSSTDHAQGGVAAVFGGGDTFDAHVADTLRVGDGLCHPAIVRAVVEGGPRAIERLLEWGGQFDRAEGGRLALGLEAGHSAERVVHAMGDGTGREIERVLVEQVRRSPRITVREHAFALDVLADGARATGVVLHHGGALAVVRCGAVVCAAGGCGQLFRETTNPEVATGDGHALLYRAGVAMRGMEFMQFHPTTLYVAGSGRLLISEAARGEGGVLRNKDGAAFMQQADAQGDLAPRDRLSRAVQAEMVRTRHPNVYLDLRHLPPAFVRQRFPRIHRVCLTFGLDITRDLIPVTPAAHYMIGGAAVDADGRTSLPHLFAAGECASSGLHGANRLASNSLLEGLVLGDRCGEAAAACAALPREAPDAREAAPPRERREDRDFSAVDLVNSVKSLMWKRVGIVRGGIELAEAERRLESWQQGADQCARAHPRDWELRNLLAVARLMTRAARERAESRGTHHRADFPARDDARWRGDLVLRAGLDGEPEIALAPFEPGERAPPRRPEAGE